MTLEQLSAAATQGEWSVCEYDAGSYIYDAGGSPTPSIQCEEADCAIVHWDGFKQEYWVSANGNAKQIEANAAFIVALVNAYRTGQLVAVADDAVGRYRHVKRGTVYEIVGEAELQTNADNLVDGSQMMVYRGEDGKLWCRHYDEFHDGRFAAMKDTQP